MQGMSCYRVVRVLHVKAKQMNECNFVGATYIDEDLGVCAVADHIVDGASVHATITVKNCVSMRYSEAV